jgi:outer membrane protein assembly factor BamB
MLSSPAVSGGINDQIVFAGDVGGTFHGYDAATGAQLFSFTAGGPVISSPAISDGHVYIASLDGNLYAFAP